MTEQEMKDRIERLEAELKMWHLHGNDIPDILDAVGEFMTTLNLAPVGRAAAERLQSILGLKSIFLRMILAMKGNDDASA